MNDPSQLNNLRAMLAYNRPVPETMSNSFSLGPGMGFSPVSIDYSGIQMDRARNAMGQQQQAPDFWGGMNGSPQQQVPAYVQPQRSIQQISREAGFPMAPGQGDGITMPDWGIQSNVKNYLKQLLNR